MQSAPARIACTSVITLRPGRAAPGRRPRSTASSMRPSSPSRSARVAGRMRPALATARSSSKTTWSPSNRRSARFARPLAAVTIGVTS